MERRNYEMSQEDLDKILNACKVGGMVPRSPQENANAAWAELGEKMGFDPMTVMLDGGDIKCFSAVPVKE